jgi:hypothetical protein
MVDADPAALRILEYWFGSDWATAGKYALNSACMPLWFRGGPQVDQVRLLGLGFSMAV